MINYDKLFSIFLNAEGKMTTEELNFTRAGYVHKVIISLLNS